MEKMRGRKWTEKNKRASIEGEEKEGVNEISEWEIRSIEKEIRDREGGGE